MMTERKMIQTRITQKEVDQIFNDIEEFESTHPEIVEAMHLFDIGMEQYRISMLALYNEFTCNLTTNSTNPDVNNAIMDDARKKIKRKERREDAE